MWVIAAKTLRWSSKVSWNLACHSRRKKTRSITCRTHNQVSQSVMLLLMAYHLPRWLWAPSKSNLLTKMCTFSLNKKSKSVEYLSFKAIKWNTWGHKTTQSPCRILYACSSHWTLNRWVNALLVTRFTTIQISQALKTFKDQILPQKVPRLQSKSAVKSNRVRKKRGKLRRRLNLVQHVRSSESSISLWYVIRKIRTKHHLMFTQQHLTKSSRNLSHADRQIRRVISATTNQSFILVTMNSLNDARKYLSTSTRSWGATKRLSRWRLTDFTKSVRRLLTSDFA